MNTKGPKVNRQNQLRSPMPDGGEPYFDHDYVGHNNLYILNLLNDVFY